MKNVPKISLSGNQFAYLGVLAEDEDKRFCAQPLSDLAEPVRPIIETTFQGETRKHAERVSEPFTGSVHEEVIARAAKHVVELVNQKPLFIMCCATHERVMQVLLEPTERITLHGDEPALSHVVAGEESKLVSLSLLASKLELVRIGIEARVNEEVRQLGDSVGATRAILEQLMLEREELEPYQSLDTMKRLEEVKASIAEHEEIREADLAERYRKSNFEKELAARSLPKALERERPPVDEAKHLEEAIFFLSQWCEGLRTFLEGKSEYVVPLIAERLLNDLFKVTLDLEKEVPMVAPLEKASPKEGVSSLSIIALVRVFVKRWKP